MVHSLAARVPEFWGLHVRVRRAHCTSCRTWLVPGMHPAVIDHCHAPMHPCIYASTHACMLHACMCPCIAPPQAGEDARLPAGVCTGECAWARPGCNPAVAPLPPRRAHRAGGWGRGLGGWGLGQGEMAPEPDAGWPAGRLEGALATLAALQGGRTEPRPTLGCGGGLGFGSRVTTAGGGPGPGEPGGPGLLTNLASHLPPAGAQRRRHRAAGAAAGPPVVALCRRHARPAHHAAPVGGRVVGGFYDVFVIIVGWQQQEREREQRRERRWK